MTAKSALVLAFALFIFFGPVGSAVAAEPNGNSNLFREYIGAEEMGVKFSDVPINPNVEFHFILSFGIDYTASDKAPTPTNGVFGAFWDTQNLSPSAVSSIKARNPNVKVALSLGGDSVGQKNATFMVKSIDSWVNNAVASLTRIAQQFKLDGIDIDYEHFGTDTNTFAECIGRLLVQLKRRKVISFASIAPYDSDEVQPYYQDFWRKYGNLIDYVNFQFYAYDSGTTVPQFLRFFDEQSSNYQGGKILVSMGTDGSGGLSPQNGFFKACNQLKRSGKLNGIFIWSADNSKEAGFPFEKQAQTLLASK
ncbi:hypothetical protein MLD38_017315 [Melastoma candidum]|uniref:Uncharacterized protein n=1 Tax=Melastoma candidum TaxID=119954 RepID=A0ACB9QS55_9MYRT|nr:hypothetical protein MLD38_017315 [Melastoma candidum]